MTDEKKGDRSNDSSKQAVSRCDTLNLVDDIDAHEYIDAFEWLVNSEV